jgi:outer membrane immunogenic protein
LGAHRSITNVEGHFMMKRFAIAVALTVGAGSVALAADLPPPAPAPRATAAYIPISPPYNWSGFYIGGNIGAGFNGSGSLSDTASSNFSTTTSTTFLGGGQVGVNYEFSGGVVVGAEAMFDALTPNSQNTISLTGAAGSTAAAMINNHWLTTATGKLGYAWDRVLLYGKGGGAWVGASTPGFSIGGLPASLTSTSSNNSFGWTVGAGVEWAFWGNWSARAEYDFVGLQNQSFTVAGGGTPFAGDTINISNRNINIVTAGVNYKFGGWW